MPIVRVEVVVSGRVQGVWFRQSTKQQADAWGVNGWVRNNPDRTVSAVFEGEEPAVKAVLDWCHRGPGLARVDSVQDTWASPTGEFNQFSVKG